MRALHFPRASLPIALALQQLQQLLFSLATLAVILLACGIRPGASWLLVVPALALQALFNTGLTLALARLTARTPDVSQLMPFVLRTWMHGSGVMWSIQHVLADRDLPALVAAVLPSQPSRALHRPDALRAHRQLHLRAAAAARVGRRAGWAVAAFAGGFVYFWKAEETYGRG